MLKPANMCLLRCVIAKESKDALVSALHREGICQLIHLGDEDLRDAGVGRDKPLERAEEVAALLQRTTQALDSLKAHRNADTNFLQEMLGVERTEKTPAPATESADVIEYAKEVLSRVENRLEDLTNDNTRLRDENSRSRDRVSELEPFKDLDIPGSYFRDGDLTHSVLGIQPIPKDEVTAKLGEAFGKNWASSVHLGGKNEQIVSYHVHSSDAFELDQILYSHGFRKVDVQSASTPKKEYLLAADTLESTRKQLTENALDLSNLAAHAYDELRIAHEILSLEYEVSSAPKRFGSTEKLSYFMLWAPQKNRERVEELVDEASNGLCHTSVEEDPQDAPTLLENPRLLKPFEMLTRLFSPPRYGQMDPTWVTAPTFVLFFGFMVGDAIYGAAILAATHLLRKKYAKYSDKVADLTYILLWCGASTILFGVLTGGYLGDFAAKYVAGTVPQNLPLVVIDPLYKSNSVTLLGVAVLVGLIHTISGNLLGFFDKFSQRRRSEAVKENLSWLLVIAGVGVIAFGETLAGAAVFVVGFLLLLSGLGFMAVMELPTLLGRVVSYARLLALNLTTPGMGMAFNFLASLLYGFPVVGPVAAGLVFIGSHIIILLMNSLGSFVHSLRLHYVEFYGTFYGGGGLEYEPFGEDRKYTLRN